MGGFSEGREGRFFLHFLQHTAALFGGAKYAKIGRMLGTVGGGQTEECPQDETLQTRQGLSSGGGETEEFLHGSCLLPRLDQPVGKPLCCARIGQPGPIVDCHGTYFGEDGPLRMDEGGQADGILLQKFPSAGGEVVFHQIPLARSQMMADAGGGQDRILRPKVAADIFCRRGYSGTESDFFAVAQAGALHSSGDNGAGERIEGTDVL